MTRWTSSWVLLVAASARCAAGLRQPWEYLDALKQFQDSWVNPSAVVEKGYSDILADDIVGRVDVTTTFEGNELNVEYLFGFFGEIQKDVNSTSIIGYPVSQEIQALVVEPPLVYFSAVVQLAYPTIGYNFPVQIDMTTEWNDELKMVSYDAVFRRWPQAYYYLAPIIAPQIAKEMNETYDEATTNVTDLFQRKAAGEICEIAMQYCTGDNEQYSSYDQCYEFLAVQTPWGEPWEGGSNTGFCRYIHRNMVPYRPQIHCEHIGPSGGDMCIDRDYLQVVNDYPYSNTLVAPNSSWDDRDMRGLSEHSVSELAKAKLRIVVPTTVAFYSVPIMSFFGFLYLSAQLVDFVLRQTSDEFKLLTVTNQRNTVTYFLNTFYTTLALGFQLYSTPALAHAYRYAGIDSIVITASIISALYLFEMIYRMHMRASLLAHHFCTLLAIISLFVSIENTFHPATITIGVIWLFQATTEQSVFVGLLMYRLKYNPKIVRQVLRFAAVQSFFVKFVFAVYLLVEHSLKLVQFHEVGTDVYFSVIVYGIGILLLATQVYGSWAVWAISLKLTAQLKANSDGRQSCPATPGAATGGFFRLEDDESMRKRRQREQLLKLDVSYGGFDPDAVEFRDP
ncbi:hypothetical protein JCM1840_005368 [Sporobolomyces johnsonii]